MSSMEYQFSIAISIFALTFLGIIFEVYNKALLAIFGGMLMVLTGVLNFEEAASAVDLDTIGLLIGMMLIVDVVNISGIFSWMSVKIAKLTRGKPWLIFILFCTITFLFSTFLNNVTVILIILPVVLALTKGIGLEPKFFIIATIFYSIIGGALTLIGDPTNVIIGTKAGLGFNEFIINMSIPVLSIFVVLLLVLMVTNWYALKPISGNLKQLFLSNLLIQKIESQFVKKEISASFIIKIVSVFILVMLGFVFGDSLGLNPSVIALTGGTILFLITSKYSSINESLPKIEWPTLFFFSGLFVLVAGLEKVGFLEMIGHQVIGVADNYLYLLLILLWISGFASMIIDNVPFVTMMIPVVLQVQETLPPDVDSQLLWWAMALGATLGGCGSPIGSAVNVVSLELAHKNGYHISSVAYLKIAFPLTLLMLGICSLYFIFLLR